MNFRIVQKTHPRGKIHDEMVPLHMFFAECFSIMSGRTSCMAFLADVADTVRSSSRKRIVIPNLNVIWAIV